MVFGSVNADGKTCEERIPKCERPILEKIGLFYTIKPYYIYIQSIL